MTEEHLPTPMRSAKATRPYPQDYPRPEWVKAIIREVAIERQVSVVDILMKGRGTPSAAAARQEAMRRVRNYLDWTGNHPSYPRVGAWFHRHHTTVMWACGAVK